MAELLRRRAALLLVAALLAVVVACGDDGGTDAEDSSDPSEQDDRSGDDASGDDDTDDSDGGGSAEGGDEGSDDEVEPIEPAELPAEVVPYADALAGTFVTDGNFTTIDDGQAQCIATNVVAILGADRLAASGLSPEAFGATPDLAALGIDRDDAEDIYAVFEACGVDYRTNVIDGIVLEAADRPGVRDCVEDVLDDAIVRELAIAALLGGVEDSPETSAALGALQACTAPTPG